MVCDERNRAASVIAASYPMSMATHCKHLEQGWTAYAKDKASACGASICRHAVSPEVEQMSRNMPLPFGSVKFMAGIVKRDHLSWGWSEPITQHR